jgi:hypothetical protein
LSTDPQGGSPGGIRRPGAGHGRERPAVGVSRLLDRVTLEWLKARSSTAEDDEAEQARLHAIAMQVAGAIRGGDPNRAAEADKRVRELLARKYGRL